ncbi:MAG: hypothetical protein ACW99A_13555 [Candidatus Kariarchaeaceae archaeon]|jgi:hypothetical protein
MAEQANMVKCDVCKEDVPLSCVVIDKGSIAPDLMRDEHKRHEIEICYKCLYKFKESRQTPAS